jgi:hypothetical protein
MVSGSWARYAPLSGVLAVAIVVVSVIVAGFDSVDSNDSVAKIVDFWKDNDSEQMTSAVLGAISMIPLLWFLGSLRSAFRAAEGETGRLSSIAFGAGIVLVGFILVNSTLQFAVADTVGDVPPVATQTLSVLYSDCFFGFPVGFGVLLLASSLVILRTRVLPTWLGWASLVLAIVFFTPAGEYLFPLVLLWIVVMSVMLYQQQAPARPAPTAVPTA